ncbi:MAG: sulfotransferase, partial [Myxococcota bacterium]|nr:sulfotransferase [Myxococcota bacterium]
CVVTTARDIVKIVPSVASLTAVGMRSVVADFDPHVHGRAQLDLWKRGLAKIETVCSTLPEDRLYRMDFDDFQADPLREAKRIYGRFGLGLSTEAEIAMRGWCDRNRRGSHGAHDYSPEEFGLTAEQIRTEFA